MQLLLEALARVAPALADIHFGGLFIVGSTGFEVVGAAPIANATLLQSALAPLAASLANGSIFTNQTLIQSGIFVPTYTT